MDVKSPRARHRPLVPLCYMLHPYVKEDRGNRENLSFKPFPRGTCSYSLCKLPHRPRLRNGYWQPVRVGAAYSKGINGLTNTNVRVTVKSNLTRPLPSNDDNEGGLNTKLSFCGLNKALSARAHTHRKDTIVGSVGKSR